MCVIRPCLMYHAIEQPTIILLFAIIRPVSCHALVFYFFTFF